MRELDLKFREGNMALFTATAWKLLCSNLMYSVYPISFPRRMLSAFLDICSDPDWDFIILMRLSMIELDLRSSSLSFLFSCSKASTSNTLLVSVFLLEFTVSCLFLEVDFLSFFLGYSGKLSTIRSSSWVARFLALLILFPETLSGLSLSANSNNGVSS